MKKYGFTLSELLIAMSIIAVASALMAPAISNIMPDKNKARVLKYYNAVQETTSNLLDSETLYYAIPGFDSDGMPTLTCNNQLIEYVNLTCTSKPIESSYNSTDYEGINKYPNLLRDKLLGNKTTTTTPDGAVWTISPVNNADVAQGYTISIDMEPNNSVNHAYDSTHKKPDTYIFKVAADGKVTPGDALTEVYTKNPTRTSKKEDLDEAATVTTTF